MENSNKTRKLSSIVSKILDERIFFDQKICDFNRNVYAQSYTMEYVGNTPKGRSRELSTGKVCIDCFKRHFEMSSQQYELW
jgi:hypothetical protein